MARFVVVSIYLIPADTAVFRHFMSLFKALEAVVVTTFSQDWVQTNVQTNSTIKLIFLNPSPKLVESMLHVKWLFYPLIVLSFVILIKSLPNNLPEVGRREGMTFIDWFRSSWFRSCRKLGFATLKTLYHQ